jgi:hypothetical protein
MVEQRDAELKTISAMFGTSGVMTGVGSRVLPVEVGTSSIGDTHNSQDIGSLLV